MSYWPRWLAGTAVLCSIPVLCHGQDAVTEWSESQIIDRFLSLSPQARELRARVSLAEAETRTRLVYPNPWVGYARRCRLQRLLRSLSNSTVSPPDAVFTRRGRGYRVRGRSESGCGAMVAAQRSSTCILSNGCLPGTRAPSLR